MPTMAIPSPTRRCLPLAALGLLSTRAQATVLLAAPDCSVSGNSLQCRLAGVLNFLTIAAALLAVLLVGVIVLAVRSVRNNKRDKDRQ